MLSSSLSSSKAVPTPLLNSVPIFEYVIIFVSFYISNKTALVFPNTTPSIRKPTPNI